MMSEEVVGHKIAFVGIKDGWPIYRCGVCYKSGADLLFAESYAYFNLRYQRVAYVAEARRFRFASNAGLIDQVYCRSCSLLISFKPASGLFGSLGTYFGNSVQYNVASKLSPLFSPQRRFFTFLAMRN